MNRIIKEELMRSIGIFFFALLGTTIIVINTDIQANFFSVLGTPLLITFTIFLFFVYYRNRTTKEPKLKLERGTFQHKFLMYILIILGIFLIPYGIISYFLNQKIYFVVFDIFLGLLLVIS